MVKSPHFFKARSRIGLVNPPLGSDELNIGVEDAPDAILQKSFLKKFPSYRMDEFDFSDPQKILDGKFFIVAAKELIAFKNLIVHRTKRQETPAVIGGDDCVTLASLIATCERVGDVNKIGYLRVDSHADMNLYKTSLTKNFHGMYHRPLFGDFDIGEIAKIVKFKLNPENVLFVGNLNLDREEKVFFKKQMFTNISSRDLKNQDSYSRIGFFVKSHDFLHVSIDIDGFDRSIATATGIPAKSGLNLAEILPVIEVIAKHRNLAVDLVEVNPIRQGAGRTIQLAQLILEKLLH